MQAVADKLQAAASVADGWKIVGIFFYLAGRVISMLFPPFRSYFLEGELAPYLHTCGEAINYY